MTDVMFLIFRTFFLTIVTLGMMASLTEFRFGCKKLLGILAVYSVWVVFISGIMLYVGGELLLLRLFFPVISVPAIILTYWAANDTPSQAVFNYITQILVSVLVASLIRMLTESIGLSGFVNVLLMCIVYFAAIYLEWRFLRRPFRLLIKVLPGRWGVLTLIPCVFCAYFIFVAAWPGSYLENDTQRAYLYAAILPLVIVYLAVFKILLAQYHMQMERQSAALLTVQISTLKEKLQRVKEVAEDVRIQRHDLRHQLQAVAELVVRGEREAALEFLGAARERLDEQVEVRWCRPPVLDAVFSSYFDQARRQNIPVEATIALPDELPVDEGEMAVVLANALENAIHANLALPPERRQICCRAMGTPSLMLEISNPCAGDVTFNEQGLPVAENPSHGLGVRSIAAFCKKHGAVCQFELTGGTFSLRLVL